MFIQRGLICLCVETVCLWDKSDLHEADFFVSHLTTAKAAGYSATAPHGAGFIGGGALHSINRIP